MKTDAAKRVVNHDGLPVFLVMEVFVVFINVHCKKKLVSLIVRQGKIL